MYLEVEFHCGLETNGKKCVRMGGSRKYGHTVYGGCVDEGHTLRKYRPLELDEHD